jgi:tRNA isopentenyl-2-thiomethyl-A-37 hydroxylase MiaE
MYSNNEKVDMLLILGKCDRNARGAATMYATRYPERHHPCPKMCYNIEKSLSHGQFVKEKRNKRKTVTNDDNAIIVLAHFEENPHTSIRSVAAATGLSARSINRITKKNSYHPHKISKVQHLRVTDAERRLNFIAWFVVAYECNPEILNNILWTDECKFSNNGVTNRHNYHFWSSHNSHWFREHNFQEKITINVWCD